MLYYAWKRAQKQYFVSYKQLSDIMKCVAWGGDFVSQGDDAQTSFYEVINKYFVSWDLFDD